MDGKKETAEDIHLVVADVDGALVTPDKVVTPRARAAVRRIIDAGIAFTITSGRPPRGMKMLIDDLQLQDPVTAFNGGLFLNPDLSVIRENVLPREAVQPVIDILTKHKLDVWIYSDQDWYVPSRHGFTWTVKSGR
jgi:hydroxymethylpyrimidine pyrophosphatase-like HAD family hydrolase